MTRTPMEQRITLVTLGVLDLEREKRFDAALGWKGQEVEQTVFFRAGGLALVLWSREALARDSGVEPGDPAAFGGVVLAHNVRSREEVDTLVGAAERAGATVKRPPRETS